MKTGGAFGTGMPHSWPNPDPAFGYDLTARELSSQRLSHRAVSLFRTARARSPW